MLSLRCVALAGVMVALASISSVAIAKPWRSQTGVPSTAVVFEALDVGIAGPTRKVVFSVGAHSWWRDYLLFGFRLVGADMKAKLDLSGDGNPDFKASNVGPFAEGQFDLGLPLRWRLKSSLAEVIRGPSDNGTTEIAEVTQLSLVSGLRIAISTDLQTAIPIGLRWSKHLVMHKVFGRAYRERWLQMRALVFAPGGQIGADAEALWMPMRNVAVIVYAEWIPMLRAIEGELDCTGRGVFEECESRTPINAFNPLPERSSTAIGLRLRATFAE